MPAQTRPHTEDPQLQEAIEDTLAGLERLLEAMPDSDDYRAPLVTVRRVLLARVNRVPLSAVQPR